MRNTLLSKVLDRSISIFNSVESYCGADITIGDVLRDFRSNKYAATISDARNFLDRNDVMGYKAIKRQLPVVTFSGKFEGGRKKENLIDYSNVIVLDIDDLSKDELNRTKDCLKADEYVFAYWESPSKQGIKGLVYVTYNNVYDSLDVYHKHAFRQLKKYFIENYKITLDSSGSDFTRLCFACWDKKLVIKNVVIPFQVQAPIETGCKMKTQQPVKTGGRCVLEGIRNIEGRNSISKRIEMESIIRYLKKHKRSITYNYQDWLDVAFAIVSTFNADLGVKYFSQLSQLDVDKFDETACKQLLYNCYRNSRGDITFASIIYKAQQQGYKKV